MERQFLRFLPQMFLQLAEITWQSDRQLSQQLWLDEEVSGAFKRKLQIAAGHLTLLHDVSMPVPVTVANPGGQS